MSASTSSPSLRALMCSMAGSLTAVSDIAAPRGRDRTGASIAEFGSKQHYLGYIQAGDRNHPAGSINDMAQRATTSPSRADELAHDLQVEIITGRIPMG